MRIEVKMTEVLVHLTPTEAEHIRDDVDDGELSDLQERLQDAMPNAEDEDDDWEPREDDDDEDDEDDDPVAKYDDDALEDK